MGGTPALGEREQLILHAVVHTYITTAEPVGSRSVVKRFGLELSPATVRNVMADLEDLGYLGQIHTSSGRVPTDKGYRYYVDYLMRVQDLTLAEREQIAQEFERKLNDADEVLRQTSHLLALVTHQAGIAEAPSDDEVRVQRLELFPFAPRRIAMLVVDNFGRVRTLTVETRDQLDAASVPALSAFLNAHLRGVALDEMGAVLQRRLQSFFDEQRVLAEQALQLLRHMPEQRPVQLFLDGADQLFEQPEFADVDRARRVFGLMDERDRLAALLRASVARTPGGGSIYIGGGDDGSGLEDFSVVAAPYRVAGKPVGMVGVLGPRRMPYPHLAAIVDYTAGLVGKVLSRLSR